MPDNIPGVSPILAVADPPRCAEWHRDEPGFEILFVADYVELPTYGVIGRGGAEIHPGREGRTMGGPVSSQLGHPCF